MAFHSSANEPFKLSLWTALQLQHFLNTLPNPQGFNRPLTSFEAYCSKEGSLPQALSKTYALLNCPAEQPHLPFLNKWESKLGRTFTSAQIQHVLRFSLKSSVCTKIKETNYKLLTRWYLTLQLLTNVGDARGMEEHDFTYFGRALNWSTSGRQINHAKIYGIQGSWWSSFFLLHVSSIWAKLYKNSIPNEMEDLVLTAQHQQEKYSKTWGLWNQFVVSAEGTALLGT